MGENRLPVQGSQWSLLHPAQHRWYVSLETYPACTSMRFGHMSRATGHQIWDELIWPLSSDCQSESGILAEIYQGTLDFWHARR